MWKNADNLDLFGGLNHEPAIGSLRIPDGQLRFYPDFLSQPEADDAFHSLFEQTPWVQETIQLYGKQYLSPRLTAWYGDQGKNYRYSGINHEALSWTPLLDRIRQRLKHKVGITFNSVLLNLYRSGADSVAWHADDEPELGQNPVIASVSLGVARPFQLKHKTRRSEKRTLTLENGSCLLMYGTFQHHWIHQLPKCPAITGQRINLTFRNIRKRAGNPPGRYGK